MDSKKGFGSGFQIVKRKYSNEGYYVVPRVGSELTNPNVISLQDVKNEGTNKKSNTHVNNLGV